MRACRLSSAPLGRLAQPHGAGDAGDTVSGQTKNRRTATVADAIIQRLGHRARPFVAAPPAHCRRLGGHYQQAPSLTPTGQGISCQTGSSG